MKKILFMIMLPLLIQIESFNSIEQEDELIEIISLFEKDSLNEITWQVTINEKISRQQFDNIVKKLKDSQLVSVNQHENSIIYNIGNSNNEMIRLSAHFVSITDDVVNFSVNMTGNAWNEKIKNEYLTKKQQVNYQYFTKNSKIFSCLTIEKDDIVKDRGFFKKASQKLNMIHIEKQIDNVNDKIFDETYYGYVPSWEQKIEIDKQPVNFQLNAKMDATSKNKLTVGTPILINEY